MNVNKIVDTTVQKLSIVRIRQYHHYHRDGMVTIKYGDSVSKPQKRRRHHKRKDSKYLQEVSDFDKLTYLDQQYLLSSERSPASSPAGGSYDRWDENTFFQSDFSTVPYELNSPSQTRLVPSPDYRETLDVELEQVLAIVTHKPDIVWSQHLKRYVAPDYSSNEIEVDQMNRRECALKQQRSRD